MTDRCRILALLAMAGALLGILRFQSALTGLSLATLFWIFGSWAWLTLRVYWIWPRLQIERSFNGRRDLPTTLWAGRSVEVQLVVRSPSKIQLPAMTMMQDLLPASVRTESGKSHELLLRSAAAVTLKYFCRCPAAGMVEWFGVHMRFQDSLGLFAIEKTFQQQRAFRVLPAYSPAGDTKPIIKRTNSLPRQGIHQLKRSGLGAELLELKEYQPGDPPKSIAWKVSARRGHLMTRQYESEVPVRITLLLDGGNGMRVGELGQRPIDKAIHLAASIAKAAVGLGDSVGLTCTEDETLYSRFRPAAGDRAFYRTLESLAKFSMVKNLRNDGVATTLSRRAQQKMVSLAEERYPELLERRLESWSWSLFPITADARRNLRERRKLATVLSELYGLSPTQQIELLHDPERLAEYGDRWLDEMGVPLTTSDVANRPAPSEIHLPALARELTKSVALAKDNEVFVIIACTLLAPENHLDTNEISPGQDELLSAAKVALARHHRVVFLSPLPVSGRVAGDKTPKTLEEVGQQVLRLHTQNRATAFRRRLRSIGAQSAFFEDYRAIASVMAEAELAGSGRFKSSSRT